MLVYATAEPVLCVDTFAHNLSKDELVYAVFELLQLRHPVETKILLSWTGRLSMNSLTFRYWNVWLLYYFNLLEIADAGASGTNAEHFTEESCLGSQGFTFLFLGVIAGLID